MLSRTIDSVSWRRSLSSWRASFIDIEPLRIPDRACSALALFAQDLGQRRAVLFAMSRTTSLSAMRSASRSAKRSGDALSACRRIVALLTMIFDLCRQHRIHWDGVVGNPRLRPWGRARAEASSTGPAHRSLHHQTLIFMSPQPALWRRRRRWNPSWREALRSASISSAAL